MGDESPFRETVLKGKVALITGGGSGICFEIDSQFGLQEARVAILGRRKQVPEAAVASFRSLGIQGRVVETVVNAFGRLDIFINGAAGNFPVAPEDLSPNGFKTDFQVFVCYLKLSEGTTETKSSN